MLKLHGYWRSGAAYRVRLALHYKGIAFAQVTHDLRRGAQTEPAYTAINPQGMVPSLTTEDGTITQSLAILEWLEETHPSPALLPQSAIARAEVRAMAAIIVCDIHPLHNLRVQNALRAAGLDEAAIRAWMGHWIGSGLAALEPRVAARGGPFAFGEAVSLLDCCLVPQIFSAERFGVGVSGFPAICAAVAAVRATAWAEAAHPSRQPDADP